MARDGIPRRLLEAVDRPFEAGILERLDLPAGVADEMVVMLAAGADGLEARDARAEVDALQEPLGGEQLEHAVDARDPDAAAVCAQAVEDLLSGQAAVLLGKELDHGAACTPVAEALAVQGLERCLTPLGHSIDDSRSQK